MLKKSYNKYKSFSLLLFFSLFQIFFSYSSISKETEILEGEYIAILSGCYSCHTDIKSNEPYSGGRKIVTNFGVFYSPNITPDKLTGIGNWSDSDFVNAFKRGKSPNGKHYLPVFPYTSYVGMKERDILNLKKYLFSIKPINKANKTHDIFFILKSDIVLGIWKTLFFRNEVYIYDNNYSEKWNRGKYIVEHLAHCGECHTPRNIFGAVNKNSYLSGSDFSATREKTPGITNDHNNGIGGWTLQEFESFMLNGMKPNFDNVQGSMEEVISHSTSKFNKYDIISIYEYIKTITKK